MPSGRSARPFAPGASRRSWSCSQRFDGVGPRRHPRARGGAGRGPGRAGPRRPRRRWRSRSAGCAPPARPSGRPTSVTTYGSATVTQRMVPVGRVGLYVPGGVAPAGLQRRDERRAGPGGRRRLDRAVLLAAEGPRRAAAPDDPGRVRAARASTRCTPSAGRRRSRCSPTAPAPAGGSTWSPGRARSTPSPPSGCSRAIIGIDSEAGPTEIAVLADDSADAAYVAADLISQAEHDVLASSVLVTPSERLADDVEAELEKQVLATRHTDRIRTSLTSQQSAIVLVDDLEQGLAVVDALRRRAPRDPDRGRRGLGRPGPQRRRDLRRLLRPGVAGRLLRRLQPRAADGRLRVPLLGAVGAGVPQVGARRRLRPRRPGRGGRPRGRPGRGRGPAGPRRGGPRALRSHDASRRCARSSSASRRTARPSSTCPCRSTSTRTPTRPRRGGGRRTSPPSVAAVAGGLNRYPDREFTELRSALAAYLSTDGGHGVTADQVWAANGSNEVMLHLLQAFGGPGRTAVSFAPTYSMYPEYARDTGTRWVAGRRASRLRARPGARARAGARRERPSVVLLPSPNNPTGTALPLDVVAALCEAGGRRAGGGGRGVRRVPPRRHAERAGAAAVAAQPGRRRGR